MTLAIQDHIHIATSSPPVTEYKVYHDGYNPRVDTPFFAERSITGKVHAHRLFESGAVKQFVAHSLRLKLTLTEKNAISALGGQRIYYVPNYHDDDLISSYIVRCYMVVTKQVPIEPQARYWAVVVDMVDDTI